MATIESFCGYPWRRVKIQCNGEITMCCHQTYHRLGNLFTNSFEDIWFGNTANQIREETLAGRFHLFCKTPECPMAYNKISSKHNIRNDGYPLELEFDLHTSFCNFGGLTADTNHTCIMCPRSKPETKKFIKDHPDRTDELLHKVKHLMPKLTRLCVMGVAEPFWKGKLFDIFDILEFDKHKQRTLFWTNTNGSVFNPETQSQFLDCADKSLIHFSLDAATPETFMKISAITYSRKYVKIYDTGIASKGKITDHACSTTST